MTDTATTGNEQNIGRKSPFGSVRKKSKVKLTAASILAGEAEQLLRTAIEMAKAGDKDMLKFLLARSLPKERAIRLDLPVLDYASDAVDALSKVAGAVRNGDVTPAEA